MRCILGIDVYFGGKFLNIVLLKLNCLYNWFEMSIIGKLKFVIGK